MTSIVLFLILSCSTFSQTSKSPAAATTDWSQVDNLYFHRNNLGNLAQSITLLKQMVAENPNDSQALWRLGRSLEKFGEMQKGPKQMLKTFDEAEKALKKSIEIGPNNAEAHFFLGVTWGRIGQTRGVLKSLFLVGPIKKEMHKTLELNPSHSGAHHVLGEMLRQTPKFAGGSKKGAIRELEKALELDPNYTSVYTDLAEAYLEVGEREKAKETLEKIFTVKNPADPADFPDDLKLAREMLAKLKAK